jgi:hypothetical protein
VTSKFQPSCMDKWSLMKIERLDLLFPNGDASRRYICGLKPSCSSARPLILNSKKVEEIPIECLRVEGGSRSKRRGCRI